MLTSGRHRGLPVAIDRAILLPQAYTRFDRQSDGSGGEIGRSDVNTGHIVSSTSQKKPEKAA